MLTDEIFKDCIGNHSTSSIALDHVHLVGLPGIDVAIHNIADVRVRSQRPHTASTAPIAIDILNENVLRGALCFIRRMLPDLI